MTSEEKYVSIDYEIWHNKYKPMEEENHRLKAELSNKDIRITFSTGETFHYRIGYVKFNADIWSVQIDDTRKLSEAIERLLNEKHNTGYGSITGRHYSPSRYLTKAEAESIEKRISKVQEELNRREAYLWKLEKKLRKIPFFIRWIFKIHFEK